MYSRYRKSYKQISLKLRSRKAPSTPSPAY